MTTICDIRLMLLLLLHINETNASQASCRKMRTPLRYRAFFSKFSSDRDHILYNAERLVSKLKYCLIKASVSSSLEIHSLVDTRSSGSKYVR